MLVGGRSRRVVASFAVVILATAVMSFAGGERASAAFACPSGPTYTVDPGDGWFAIADRVDVSPGALLDANEASIRDLLVPGDRLCLPPGADVTAACDATYSVRPGDGWYAIADRSGVSVGELIAVNGTTLSGSLYPGQTICLPAGTSTPAGSSPGASSSGGQTYTVVQGDSWYGIASRAGVSGRALLAANDAQASDLIVPGLVIRLPAGARRPTPRAAPSRSWVALDALPAQGPCWFGDTWGDARSGGRRHLGVDMFTTRRAYVYAVVDGRLTGRTWQGAGSASGNSWTLTGADGTRFFYAHLDDFNPELRVGSTVAAGEILAWVGGTGNASADHLHLEIRPDGGAPVNPYPIVRGHGGCRTGTPYRQPSGWVPALRG